MPHNRVIGLSLLIPLAFLLNALVWTSQSNAQGSQEVAAWKLLIVGSMGEPGLTLSMLNNCLHVDAGTNINALKGEVSKKFNKEFNMHFLEAGRNALAKAKEEGRLDALLEQVFEHRRSIELGMTMMLGHLQEAYFTSEETRRFCKVAISKSERYLRN